MDLKYQDLTHSIIGRAMEVHRLLGPGLLSAGAYTHEVCCQTGGVAD